MAALRDKVKWLMGIRVAVVTLTLGVLIYFQIGKSTQAIPAYYGLIVATYFLTILYGLLVNRIEWLLPFPYLHVCLYIVFASTLVALTLVGEKAFSFLFIPSHPPARAPVSRQGGREWARCSGMFSL